MEIYREDAESAYRAFLENDAKVAGERHNILPSLPTFSASEELINRILEHNKVSKSDAASILAFVEFQRSLASTTLASSTLLDEIPVFTREEFENFPPTLLLSGMFYESDVIYTFEEYEEHLELTREFARTHERYALKEASQVAFRNIRIQIHKGKCVMVSKNKAPAIHFLIRHPKMRAAFENMVIPVVE